MAHIYKSGDAVKVGDTVKRTPGNEFDGQGPQTGVVLALLSSGGLAIDPHRPDKRTSHAQIGDVDVKCWRNGDDFPEYWELLSRADDKPKTVVAKAAAPFQVKGFEPRLVIKVGCKEFAAVGFLKRAAKIRRVLSSASGTDVQVAVLEESGLAVGDVDGLVAWFQKEIKKAVK